MQSAFLYSLCIAACKKASCFGGEMVFLVPWKKSLLTFNKIVLSFPSGPLYNNEMICVTAEMCEITFCTTKQYLHLLLLLLRARLH
jgi:hypothetical protein